jgi:hypothetical protein
MTGRRCVVFVPLVGGGGTFYWRKRRVALIFRRGAAFCWADRLLGCALWLEKMEEIRGMFRC